MASMTQRKVTRAVKAVKAVGAPASLAKAVQEVATDPSMNDMMAMTTERPEAFTSPAAAVLSGISLNELARREIDDVIDNLFAGNREKFIRQASSNPDAEYLASDTVVGSGPHAAIYAAAKAAAGGTRPFVIERNERAGGTFAVSRGPAFYLNSRNRKGRIAPPGVRGGALNVLPMSPIQPVDLGGQEYQSNDQLAFATRITLALYADVATGVNASSFFEGYNTREGEYQPSFYGSVGNERYTIRSRMTIIATGLGDERREVTANIDSDRVLTYSQFMAKVDDPAKLAGLGRVAVIGAGDGGKTVVEALIGQGPEVDRHGPRARPAGSDRLVRRRAGGLLRRVQRHRGRWFDTRRMGALQPQPLPQHRACVAEVRRRRDGDRHATHACRGGDRGVRGGLHQWPAVRHRDRGDRLR
jgi:hypothetical protein